MHPTAIPQRGRGLPRFLLSESIRRSDGSGPWVELAEARGKLLVITLIINDVVERQTLAVSLWGSPDGTGGETISLAAVRPRQYCGVYSNLLNLVNHPEIRYLRVQWTMHRHGKGDRTPLFGFHVFLEESGARLNSAVAGKLLSVIPHVVGAPNWSD